MAKTKPNPYRYLFFNSKGDPTGYGQGLTVAANKQADFADHFNAYSPQQRAQVTSGFGFGGAYGSGGYGSGGGGGGGGGFSYDINSDPGLLAARAAYNSGMTNLDALLRNQRTSAFVNFGDPNLAIPGFNIDPNTAAMARQNYASGNAILSRLDTSHANAARGIINTLAAHGILGSGDLGYRQGVENQAYGNNVYDARNQVLGQLNQDYQSYLDRQNALQQAVTSAIQQAYMNQLSLATSGGG